MELVCRNGYRCLGTASAKEKGGPETGPPFFGLLGWRDARQHSSGHRPRIELPSARNGPQIFCFTALLRLTREALLRERSSP